MNDQQTYAIIGAAMEVHRELDHGFLEAVYHDALCEELTLRGIPFEREKAIPVSYKGKNLTARYKADLICFGEVIVELKALSAGTGATETAQVLNYLKATGLKRALLLNFARASLEHHRFVS